MPDFQPAAIALRIARDTAQVDAATRHDDMRDASAALAGLSAAEIDAVVAQLQTPDLEAWFDDVRARGADGREGLTRDERRALLRTLGAALGVEQLARVAACLSADDLETLEQAAADRPLEFAEAWSRQRETSSVQRRHAGITDDPGERIDLHAEEHDLPPGGVGASVAGHASHPSRDSAAERRLRDGLLSARALGHVASEGVALAGSGLATGARNVAEPLLVGADLARWALRGDREPWSALAREWVDGVPSVFGDGPASKGEILLAWAPFVGAGLGVARLWQGRASIDGEQIAGALGTLAVGAVVPLAIVGGAGGRGVKPGRVDRSMHDTPAAAPPSPAAKPPPRGPTILAPDGKPYDKLHGSGRIEVAVRPDEVVIGNLDAWIALGQAAKRDPGSVRPMAPHYLRIMRDPEQWGAWALDMFLADKTQSAAGLDAPTLLHNAMWLLHHEHDLKAWPRRFTVYFPAFVPVAKNMLDMSAYTRDASRAADVDRLGLGRSGVLGVNYLRVESLVDHGLPVHEAVMRSRVGEFFSMYGYRPDVDDLSFVKGFMVRGSVYRPTP